MWSGFNLEGFYVCGRYFMKVLMRILKVVGWCFRIVSMEVFIVVFFFILIIWVWGYYMVLGYGLVILWEWCDCVCLLVKCVYFFFFLCGLGIWKYVKSEGYDDYGLLVSEKVKKYGIVVDLFEKVDFKDGVFVF